MAGSVMQKSTGLKRMASAGSSGRSSAGSPKKAKVSYPQFVVCLDEGGARGSLHRGRIYQVIRPEPGDLAQDLRVIDEEGEDYLYPSKQFEPIVLPPKIKRAIVQMS